MRRSLRGKALSRGWGRLRVDLGLEPWLMGGMDHGHLGVLGLEPGLRNASLATRFDGFLLARIDESLDTPGGAT